MSNYGQYFCDLSEDDEIISEVDINIHVDIPEYEDEIFKEKMDDLVRLIGSKTYELIKELETRQKK